MTSFIVIACLMLLVALSFVLVPLVRARNAGNGDLSASVSNVAVFRSQKREIDDDFARGAITTEERDFALNELSRRLVDEVPDAVPVVSTQTAARPWWLVALFAVLFPVAAALLYMSTGSLKALEPGATIAQASSATAATPGAEAGDAPQMSDKQILAMVDKLAEKMAQNPGDPKGWILLARSQNALGRHAEAAAAYARATALLPKDAQLFADYADATVMVQQGRFEGKPQALIKTALKLDPNNLKALALAGTAELRLGNRAGSLVYWNKLKGLVVKGSDDEKQVQAIIAEVESGRVPLAPVASPVANAAPPPTAPLATPAPASALNPPPPTATATTATTGASVTGKVMLAPDVASKLAAGDTLFVFARAKEGPRMPLAVMRIPAPKANEFPVAFNLTDAMAMAPGMSLSSFPQVVIEARISKSGNAQLQPGDISGISDAVKTSARDVMVTLSKVAP